MHRFTIRVLLIGTLAVHSLLMGPAAMPVSAEPEKEQKDASKYDKATQKRLAALDKQAKRIEQIHKQQLAKLSHLKEQAEKQG